MVLWGRKVCEYRRVGIAIEVFGHVVEGLLELTQLVDPGPGVIEVDGVWGTLSGRTTILVDP